MEQNYTINDLVMKRPASSFFHRWRDGSPLGSGITGILLHGGAAVERVVVNRSDLWFLGEDAPVQLDALMSSVNAIQEMLVFCNEKTVKLLPACPLKFKKGEASLRFKDGTITMNWDLNERICRGIIRAIRDTEFRLELPFEKSPVNVRLSEGEIFEF